MLQYTGRIAESSSESNTCHFVDIPIQPIAACILHICSYYLLPSFLTLILRYTGKMFEWFKALDLGTSHFGGLGTSPAPVPIVDIPLKTIAA